MSKISELSDGGVIQGGDTLIAVRSGGNVKVTYGGSTTANIDGGTIDGTTIGGTTTAAGSFTTLQADTSLNVDGTVTADGLTAEGTINAYRAGFTQGVQLVGDSGGNQIIGTATNDKKLIIKNQAATQGIEIVAGNKIMDLARGGDISFYEDTGTTAKLFWDAADESLGIGQAPTSALHVINSPASGESIATLEAAATKNGYVYINGDDNRRKSLVFQSGGVDKFSMGVGDSDELSTDSFFIGSGKHGGSAADLVIDSSGRVGIGEDNPVEELHISGSVPKIQIQDSDGTNQYGQFYHSSGITAIQARNGNADGIIAFQRYDGTTTDESARIDSSGNVAINRSSAAAKLDVNLGATGDIAIFRGSSSDTFTIESDGSGILLDTRNTTDGLTFQIQGSNKMRLDADGNLLVGTTSESTWESAAGFRARQSGSTTITRDGNPPLYVNRLSSDGTLLQFQKGTAVVGSIQSRSGVVSTIILDPRSGQGAGLTGAGAGGDTLRHITPTNESGVEVDGKVSLGNSNNGFKDLYLSGGVYVGGTGSANHLDDYEEGTFTPTLTDGTASNAATGGTASGRYTKIGRMVHAYIVILNKNTSGLSSGQDVFIRGLPFTAFGSGVTYPQGAIKTHKITFSDYVTAQVFQAESYLKINESASNLAADFITVGEVTSGDFEILVSISYEAA